ncbi:MAG TPA: hypothetical protein VFY23_03745 [Candidatus Limnocylindrales bacterium]|nr:hypothetical protein [Candidatus Limnocylindrales bacterium]
MTTRIDVHCVPTTGGWSCTATIDDDAGPPSTHDISVSPDDLGRLAPTAAEPTDLVRRSLEFLLEREPRGSILSRFDLPVIGRYFPEYERTIRQ